MLNDFSDKQIVSLLKNHTFWGKRACREIIRRKNDFIPRLIGILDAIAAEPNSSSEFDELYTPAALLLAQAREPRAYPSLLKLISYDYETTEMLWGEMIMELYPWILRDTFNGDSSLLPRLIEDRSISNYSRSAALEAWGMLYFDNHISREKFADYLRHLIHDVYSGRPDKDDIEVLTSIADVAREHRLEELLDDIKSVYNRNGIAKWCDKDYKTYAENFHDSVYAVEDYHIDDAFSELETWYWFDSENDEDEDEDEEFE